jgi:hypothetical protein
MVIAADRRKHCGTGLSLTFRRGISDSGPCFVYKVRDEVVDRELRPGLKRFEVQLCHLPYTQIFP